MCLRTSCAYYAIACFPALSALCGGFPPPPLLRSRQQKNFFRRKYYFQPSSLRQQLSFYRLPSFLCAPAPSCGLFRQRSGFYRGGSFAPVLRPAAGLFRACVCVFRQQAAGVVSCSPGSAAGGAEKPIKKGLPCPGLPLCFPFLYDRFRPCCYYTAFAALLSLFRLLCSVFRKCVNSFYLVRLYCC